MEADGKTVNERGARHLQGAVEQIRGTHREPSTRGDIGILPSPPSIHLTPPSSRHGAGEKGHIYLVLTKLNNYILFDGLLSIWWRQFLASAIFFIKAIERRCRARKSINQKHHK